MVPILLRARYRSENAGRAVELPATVLSHRLYIGDIMRIDISRIEPIDLNGRRVVGFARHATSQGLADQIASLRTYAAGSGALLVGLYEQVGGPSHIANEIIGQITERSSRAGADVLLITDYSRLTRGGVAHSACL